MRSTSPDLIKRRKVYYIPGYDPFPPRRYRELYRKESAVQAAISGYEIDITGGLSGPGYGWQVEAEIDGAKTRSEIEVLVWSDIVQNSQSNSILVVYWQLVRTVWIYLSTGAFFRLMRLRKGPVLAALYPIGMLLAQLGTAVFVFWAVSGAIGWVLARMLGPLLATGSLYWLTTGLALGAGAVSGIFLLRWFRARDGRFFAYYLMHDFAYSAGHRGAEPPELRRRMAEFAATIDAALNSDADEVLVVGHSSGAHLAIGILADLIRSGRLAGNGPHLGFLSLGQVVPMVSFLPDADRLRGDLRMLSTRDELVWVDVTAPGDGCSFALCDPVSVSGQSSPEKRWPLVFSAAFTQSLSPARWRALRWRFFRLHFQYLCAFDRPKDYDYFQITAGPISLRTRYAGRKPSKSRIERAVSKFTAVAL
jgi:hypothetical protein